MQNSVENEARRKRVREIFEKKKFKLTAAKEKADEFQYQAGDFLYFYWPRKELEIRIHPNLEYSRLLSLDGIHQDKTPYPDGLKFGTAMKRFPDKYSTFVPKKKSHVGRMFAVPEGVLPDFIDKLSALFASTLKDKGEWVPARDEIKPSESEALSLDDADQKLYESDPAKRAAVEEHAMRTAERYYQGLGFSVKVLGKPYDLKCEKKNLCLHVEVKGTRGDGRYVIVTRNEVKDARDHAWPSDLYVLSEMILERIDGEWVGKAGKQKIIKNWVPHDDDLKPTQFEYRVP